MTFNYTLTVNILPAQSRRIFDYTISTTVRPAAPVEQVASLTYPFVLNVRPISLNISEITKQLAADFFQNLLNTYIDEDRELKELLNYGEDRQSVIIAKRFGPIDTTGTPTVQLKLLQPVLGDIGTDDRAFISREVVNSVIDTFRVKFAPEIDATPFLRPRNTSVRINDQLGKTLRNVTLQYLALETGSVGGNDTTNNRTFEDQIFRRWYSYDFNSSELNLDFTNYENFIFYGSAALRLEAFVQKLYKLDKLTNDSKQFEGDVFTGTLAAAGATYILEQSSKLAKEKEEIIRSFDRYEQYLYFTPSGSNSPYSASFDYVDGGVEFNSIGYWPKKPNNDLYHPTESIAANWFGDQLDIARRYDEFNPNSLINTIPSYLRDDDNNAAYFTFVLMIGHFFDLIKPYIDQFPEIYSRNLNPNEQLSKDLVYNIAEAVGFPLPTLNSLYDIGDTVLEIENIPSRRDYAVEAHKRILHNLPLFVKSKGTKTALRTAMRTLGLAPQLLDVWETGASRTNFAERNSSRGVYAFEEYTNGLDFSLLPSGSITVPLSSSLRTPYPQSIEMSVKFSSPSNCTIMEGDTKWILNVATHPTNNKLGRFEIRSEVYNILMSSSYHEIFEDNIIHLSIKTQTAPPLSSLDVYEVDSYGISYESTNLTTISDFVSSWSNTDNIVIGGVGILSVGKFTGVLDEFRLSTNLSTNNSKLLAQDPSSIAGNIYSQAANNLYVQLSFNKIDNSVLSGSIINESPYKDKTLSPSLETLSTANINLSGLVRYNRTIRQPLPVAGNSNYVSQKIFIAPPQQFGPEFLSGQGVKQLSRTRSVVTNRKLTTRGGRNKVIIATSPTRIINDNIIRTMGATNINSALGIPNKYKTLDNTLEKLRKYYNQYYYVSVNYNQYIRVLSGINSVLNDYIEYFIPSKASLSRGIVIEPNILERPTFPILKNIRVYGSKTRKTLNAVASLSGSNSDYGATFTVTQTIDMYSGSELPATYNTTLAQIQREISNPSATTGIYDLQHLDWNEHREIEDSHKAIYDEDTGTWTLPTFLPRPKVTINTHASILSGSRNTYDTVPPIDWLEYQDFSGKYTDYHANVSSKISDLYANTLVYDLQHLDWQKYQFISNSYVTSSDVFQERPFIPRPKVAISPIEKEIDAITPVYSVTEDVSLQEDIRGNYIIKFAEISTKEKSDITATSMAYDLQHLDWQKYQFISNSYVTSSDVFQERPFIPRPKVAIDVEDADNILNVDVSTYNGMVVDTRTKNVNKFDYNDENRGTFGAEPYNRVYPRKLFVGEIDQPRTGGITSLQPSGIYAIPPLSDFNNVAAYNYFNKPDGIYYFPITKYYLAYSQPLNATWDFDTQTFDAATTWSYGTRYNVGDVVYQDVQRNDSQLGDSANFALAGNGKYYAFITAPQYKNLGDGPTLYETDVVSTVPPSLDGLDWRRIRFKPQIVQEPRRIVFDTFIIPTPAQNNYKTTTISVDTPIDISQRYVDSFTIPELGGNGIAQGQFLIQNIFTLFGIQSNTSDIRVRLYRTLESMIADTNRDILTLPTGAHGVLADIQVKEQNSVQLINPIITLIADSLPPGGKIYYTINNLTNTPKISNKILFYYFAAQVEPRVPKGYLAQHYRYTRDNSTAAKRRKYLGCKFRIVRYSPSGEPVYDTIDGLPPVQVFLSEGSDIIVNSSQAISEIKIGGGGTLNVI
jgi:hypothetical protein